MMMRALVRTGWQDLQRMKGAYKSGEVVSSEKTDRKEVLAVLAAQADDWLYFQAANPEMGGTRTERLAFSPSLGVYRGLTEADNFSLNLCDAAKYERLFGSVPDPVALLVPKSAVRRFHVVMTFRARTLSPESALKEFMVAAPCASWMTATIYEDWGKDVIEISGEDLVRIAQEAFSDAPDLIAKRGGDVIWGDQDRPGRSTFQVRVFHSTVADGPADAVSVFFSALRENGSMFAEVLQDNISGAVEFFQQEIARIADEVYRKREDAAPSGP